jgi:hypothetical protein
MQVKFKEMKKELGEKLLADENFLHSELREINDV